jgi:preprotein translocase subunit SecD
MKFRLRISFFYCVLTLSLASCGFSGTTQTQSEDVIEFRQVLSVASAQSTVEAYGQKFTDVDCQNPPTDFEAPIDIVGCSSDEQEIYLLGAPELDGNLIKRAEPDRDSTSGDQWFIKIEFDDIGTKKFAEFTRRVTTLPTPMNQIAITSGTLVITAPRINEEIPSGSAQITGAFTMKEAIELAKAIKNRSAIPSFLRGRE